MKLTSHLAFTSVLIVVTGCGYGERESTDAAQNKRKGNSREKTNGNDDAPDGSSSLAVFKKRILPIFQSAKPSSCAECHLSGVDLKQYIRPTQRETFTALVSAGMIDKKRPDQSKILQFIRRAPKTPNLITAKVRKAEYDAFQAWIRAAVADPKLSAMTGKSIPIGPQIPDAVIRHSRRDRVTASFIDNVWNEVGRCAACHSPDRNRKQVREHGEQVSWITLNDPQATLKYMVKNKLINARQPEKSLLLMKPTMQVEHGGGRKMVVGDRTYKQFRRFIDDYAAISQGKYTKAEQLPARSKEVSVVTGIWLKVTGVPAKFDKKLLQVDLYRRSDAGWSKFRVATSDRLVFGPKNLWQHSLSLTAPRDSRWAGEIAKKRLPPGRYLIKVYIDQTGRLQKDFNAKLGAANFVGQVEVNSRWPADYGRMTVVKFPK